MAFKYNPFTGTVDIVGGGSGGVEDSFSYEFNNTIDWGTPSGGYYSIVIPEGTHLKGINPTATVYELEAGEYVLVLTDQLKISNTGQVTFRVLETPNLRFSGKIIITR